MATLQSPRQWPTTRSRLQQTAQAHASRLAASMPPPEITEPPAPIPFPDSSQGRLTEMEQRQLLLQTASVCGGWQLVSVEQRPETDVLVAYLVSPRDELNAVAAVREGRALQIIMDAVGDLKIQHPRRRHEGRMARIFHQLAHFLGLAPDSSFSVRVR